VPHINVNLADVDSFEPLPEDEYDVEVDKVEVRMNKAGDGLYLNWELAVIDGEYENRKLWMITSLKETALFRLKQVFEDLDIIDPDDEEIEIEYDDDVEPTSSGGPRLLYPEVEGLEGIARVKNEMYDGRERNRVEQLTSGRSKSRKRKTTRNSAKASKGSKSTGRSRSRRDDDDDDDDEEEEEEEERPRRRSSSGSSRRSSSSSRRRVR
jgi:hypothetical protein